MTEDLKRATNKQLGQRIHAARKAKGLTLLEIADKVGLSEATIQRYEAGKIANVSIDMVKKIAAALGVSAQYLLGWGSDEQDSYYTDPATLAMAQALHDNPQYRVMFDSTRDMTPEDVQKVIDFIRWQRHQEGYDDD